MGRAPCCDKANVKRGPWSPEEDAKLKDYIHKFGTGGNWIALPHKAGLKRYGKSCRLRWLNYLRPNIKHGEFSDQEDRIICGLYASIGSRWSIIAAELPGRTDNDIKNYWNTKLKKKLMGITTTTKKPSSSSSIPSSYSYDHDQQLQSYSLLNHHPSSSSISSSSPYHCTSTTYYNSPCTMSFTEFETAQTMQNYPNQVKDNNTLPIFETPSCSSSDGSSIHHQVKREDQDQGINIIQPNYEARLIPNGNSGNNNNTVLWGQSHQSSLLDYGLEEIKQLISTNINVGNSFNYFDENKAMYYYY